ncbi:hypothetical protein CSKR_102665 [Clonorchis sinensis]|uniref:Uncharacterized protein n=1 Tax=Clonorchis sinensis TaxID=79923 RepID=A0A3R7FR67_CLOSI|nr:hypothetical protein CSKR_102665 [Clonorchis sinensis]
MACGNVTKSLGGVRFSGCGPRDPPYGWLEGLNDMAVITKSTLNHRHSSFPTIDQSAQNNAEEQLGHYGYQVDAMTVSKHTCPVSVYPSRETTMTSAAEFSCSSFHISLLSHCFSPLLVFTPRMIVRNGLYEAGQLAYEACD